MSSQYVDIQRLDGLPTTMAYTGMVQLIAPVRLKASKTPLTYRWR